jgi:hypothetical protein
MPPAEVNLNELISALAAARVDFIVVGGVAAVLQGAPISTFDLDLVYSRDPQNLARLEQVLRQLSACYREKPEIAPDAHRLDGPGHHLLMTRFGPLDLLGSAARQEGYPELIEHTDSIELGPGKTVRVMDLPTLIRIKESLARDRDLAVLPILRRTLAERGGK